jgi:YesN/AraC family two-component response regulator
MKKILIIDDHYIVRQGLKQILVSTFQDIIADEAINGEDAIQRITKTDYDIILLELAPPDIDGLNC